MEGGAGFFLMIISMLVCGKISQTIGESKGYTKGFWWGFGLLIFGIIVQAIRPYKDYNYLEINKKHLEKVFTQKFQGKCLKCNVDLVIINGHLECPIHGKDFIIH